VRWWWISIILLCVVLARSAENRCSVYEFQSIVLMAHDPTERHKLAVQWLRESGNRCSPQQLMYIQNRRAEWLGTADSLQIQNMINALLEK
jgi:vancomycin permeability regulator SanA